MNQKKHNNQKFKHNNSMPRLNREELSEIRNDFIDTIKRKCSFNLDFALMQSNRDSGYAKKSFKIYRKNGNPWNVQRGHLLDWSHEKFLKIQQIKHSDSKILEEGKKGEDFLDKFFKAVERAMLEQGIKEINKMVTQTFDIQWSNIESIGD